MAMFVAGAAVYLHHTFRHLSRRFEATVRHYDSDQPVAHGRLSPVWGWLAVRPQKGRGESVSDGSGVCQLSGSRSRSILTSARREDSPMTTRHGSNPPGLQPGRSQRPGPGACQPATHAERRRWGRGGGAKRRLVRRHLCISSHARPVSDLGLSYRSSVAACSKGCLLCVTQARLAAAGFTTTLSSASYCSGRGGNSGSRGNSCSSASCFRGPFTPRPARCLPRSPSSIPA